MQFRVRPFLSIPTLLLSTSFALANICAAQTTAVCKFITFKPPSGTFYASPADINNHGAVVGAVAVGINGFTYWRGLVRNADGSMSSYHYPTATPTNTFFTKRNDSGVTVGYFGLANSHGLVKSGSKVVKVDYPIGEDIHTWLFGINNFHTIVGQYTTFNPNFISGSFKLVNGKFIPVKIPNATDVSAYTINDNGAIAGSYSKTPSGLPRFHHGFRLQEDGTFMSIDHPTGLQHTGTEIRDLDGSGVMVGNWLSLDRLDDKGRELRHGFIYKNSVFKNLKYPGAQLTSAMGINNNEIIVGSAQIPTNNGGFKIVPFKATCQ